MNKITHTIKSQYLICFFFGKNPVKDLYHDFRMTAINISKNISSGQEMNVYFCKVPPAITFIDM